jgi:DNA-directed RNA polymerase subunit RPC12/RpoP
MIQFIDADKLLKRKYGLEGGRKHFYCKKCKHDFYIARGEKTIKCPYCGNKELLK